MNPEKLAARRAARELAKENARIEAEKNQPKVQSLTISIEWAKSRTWGNNPHASAEVRFHAGKYQHKDGYTCSGCGYDKESTVIAAIFDDFLRYKLWELSPEQRKSVPYGIHFYGDGSRPGYSGGIGTSCYYKISEHIGGKFEHVSSGKSFDVYRYIDNIQGVDNGKR